MTLRVFVEPEALAPGRTVALASDEAHYLLRVRRATVGDEVEVLDGAGGHVHARIAVATSKRCELTLGAAIASPVVPPIVLLLGMPEPTAALQAIMHATELGAATVVLVRCERSQGAAPGRDRIARSVRAAMRQCGRPRPPEIAGPVALEDALTRSDPRPGFVAITEARGVPTPIPRGLTGATLLVGPEGGLTPTEVAHALAADFRQLSLGPWILRTETSACAALALVLAALDDPR